MSSSSREGDIDVAMDILEEWGVLLFVSGIVMCECEGGVIIWFGWAVIGMNCGVVGVFVCRVGVVVGVVGEGRVKKV